MEKDNKQHNKTKIINTERIGSTLLLILAVLVCYNIGYILGKLIF